MTKVNRNYKTYLTTTTSYSKYFYLTNNEYYTYSSYIYLYLEDDSFNLNYNNIKYCHTNTNPYATADNAVSVCTFNNIPN